MQHPSQPFLRLISVLLLALAALVWYSATDLEVEIGSVKLKKSDFKEALFPEPEPFDRHTYLDTLTPDTMIVHTPGPVEPRPADTTRQRILLAGDSMGQSIYPSLYKYCLRNGHSLHLVARESSSMVWWGSEERLSGYIDHYQPTYIIMSLGSNELFVPHIQARDTFVRSILRQAGGIPIIWVGPPNWKEDTGINRMLQNIVGYDRFFLSKYLEMERLPDGAHPTWKAAHYWTDTLTRWIAQWSRYPIALAPPTDAQRQAWVPTPSSDSLYTEGDTLPMNRADSLRQRAEDSLFMLPDPDSLWESVQQKDSLPPESGRQDTLPRRGTRDTLTADV